LAIGLGFAWENCNITFFLFRRVLIRATVLHIFETDEESQVEFCLINLSGGDESHEIQVSSINDTKCGDAESNSSCIGVPPSNLIFIN
jgi:hypothetical protein